MCAQTRPRQNGQSTSSVLPTGRVWIGATLGISPLPATEPYAPGPLDGQPTLAGNPNAHALLLPLAWTGAPQPAFRRETHPPWYSPSQTGHCSMTLYPHNTPPRTLCVGHTTLPCTQTELVQHNPMDQTSLGLPSIAPPQVTRTLLNHVARKRPTRLIGRNSLGFMRP